MTDHYKTLGVDPDATPSEIEAARRKLSKKYDISAAEETFRKIKAAKDALDKGETSAGHYRALGIASGASPAQIKKAFNRLALVSHPDKVRPKLEKVVEACKVLSNPKKRAEYDGQNTEEEQEREAERARKKEEQRQEAEREAERRRAEQERKAERQRREELQRREAERARKEAQARQEAERRRKKNKKRKKRGRGAQPKADGKSGWRARCPTAGRSTGSIRWTSRRAGSSSPAEASRRTSSSGISSKKNGYIISRMSAAGA